MKMTKGLAFLLVTVCSLAHAQQYGWVRVAQLGNQFTLLGAVEFVDSLHGWTAEGSSMTYRTSDGGTTWVQCIVNAPLLVTSISMHDTLTGWAVGAQGSTGRILRTTDGGSNWFQQFFHFDRHYSGTATTGLQQNITSGSTRNFSRDTGKVVETTNGGAIWTEQTIADSIIAFGKVQFVDSLHGWILIYPGSGLLRTTDGGSTWRAYRLGGPVFHFLDAMNGFFATYSNTYCYKTTDGGTSWNRLGRIYDPMWDDLDARTISFTDTSNGWAFGTMFYQGGIQGVIFRTTDGGWNWSREHVGLTSSINAGIMLDQRHGWAVGSGGLVLAYRLLTSVPEKLTSVPRTFALHQNYPNPFNPITTIEYEIVERSTVTIKVYDVRGKEVRLLVDSEHDQGVYRLQFDATGLASGTYYYTMKTETFSETRQMILIH